MKLLMDTHAFIWWANEPDRLSQRALEHCENPGNNLILSVASIWEMQIKIQLGKMKLHMPIRELIESQCETNDLEVLPVVYNHVMGLDNLPPIHNDPFDRLLVAQAITENLCLISRDKKITQYPCKSLW
jgi:PIN domain nuclease of toxin-antitoxin system